MFSLKIILFRYLMEIKIEYNLSFRFIIFKNKIKFFILILYNNMEELQFINILKKIKQINLFYYSLLSKQLNSLFKQIKNSSIMEILNYRILLLILKQKYLKL